MKDKRIKLLSGLASLTALAAVSLSLTSGCKSHPAKDNTAVPPPAIQSAPAQPLPAQPATVQPPAPTLAPQPAANVAPAATPAIPDAKPDTSTYTVQKGDTFFSIAKKHGIDMQKLADYNHMSLQKPLKIGVTLKIPQK